jgi:hypothetical protein
MKKRLLLIAALAMAVGTSFAQEIGSYVYTATQRVKITGENLVTNGDFSQGKEGWTNAAGEELNADVWDFGEGEGPGGENVLKSLNGSTADAALCRAWTLSTSTYIVMYDIIGTTNTVTGIVNGNSSCASFFLTEDESLTNTHKNESNALVWNDGIVNVATVNGFKDSWKTVSYAFNAAEGQKLVMHFEKLATNTMITNIKIFPAQIVFDDRIIKSKLDYVDKLLATEKFVLDTENGFVDNVVGTLREMLNGSEEGALDDPSDVESVMEAYEEELQKWYDLNASDLLKDEKKWSSYTDTRKMNGIGGNWQGTGGRWFHINNGGSNEITNDGDEIGHRFQGGTEGNASQYYTITPKNAGTYMFSIDIVGHYMAGGKSNQTYYLGTGDNYITDWNRDFTGVTVFAGKDIMGADAEANAAMNNEQEGQKVDCGAINNPNAKLNPQKFVVFYEVSQEMVDAETPVSFGITYIMDPNRTPTKMGSNVNIANPQIRLIGVTQDIIDYQNEVAKIITQQGPLKERLQWANDDLQKTAADGYPWGHATLKHVTDSIQNIYDASLLVIDAEGQVLNAKAIKDLMAAKAAGEGIAYSDSLLNAVTTMNSARSTFSNFNKPIASYKTKITDAEAVRDDDLNSLCDRNIIQRAIDAANAKLEEVLATTTDETRDADIEILNAQLVELADAVEAFKNDAPMTPVVDIDFSNGFEEIKDGEGNGTGDYMIKGTKGQIAFSTGSVNVEDNTGAPNEKGVGTMDFALGHGEELLDVLRVGRGSATVELPEDVQVGEDDVVRFDFNIWFVQLSSGTITVELQNAEGQRLGAFGYCAYGNIPNDLNVNTFNNEANEGLNLAGYATSNRNGDVASHVDGNKNSFTLIVDGKAKGVQGNIVTSKGTCIGKMLPLNTIIDENTTITDTKVARFVLTSNYGANNGGNYVGRRCWFDDLKAYKYASKAEGPIVVGIKGDVNGDGDVDVADLIAVSNYMAGDEAVSKEKADVNGDGDVDVADLIAISNIMAGTAE